MARQDQHRLAPDPVRQDPDEGRDEDDHHGGDGRQPQRHLLAERAGRGQERGNVGDADVVSDRSQRRDGEGSADRAAMVGEAVAERAVGNGLLARPGGGIRAIPPSSSGRSRRFRRARRRRRRECASPSSQGPLRSSRRRSRPRRRPRAGRRLRWRPRRKRRSGRAGAAVRLRADRRRRRYIRRRPRSPSRSAAGSAALRPPRRSAHGSAARRWRASRRSSERPTSASCAAVPGGRRYGRRRPRPMAASDRRWRSRRASPAATLPRPEEDPRQDGREVEIEREIVPFDDGRESGDGHRAARDGSMIHGNVGHNSLRYRIKNNRI